MGKLKILSLCDGISCGKMAFDRLGIKTEYHAVEISAPVRDISDSNFKNIIRWTDDITKITWQDIKKHGPFDWVIMGPTCKSVSKASNGPGLEGTSSILFDCLRVRDLVLKYNSKAKYLIENVNMRDEYLSQFDHYIGHAGVLINSALVSGQERERYYWANFPITQPKDKGIMLNSILQLSSAKILAGSFAAGWSQSGRYADKAGKVWSSPGPGRVHYYEQRLKTVNKANTLMATKFCKGQSTATIVFLSKSRKKQRYLSVRECARLQTINDGFNFSAVSESRAYQTIGDAWTVDVIKHIFKCGVKS